VICANQVVSRAAGEVKADRIPERVNHGMDLGAQSPARTSDRLVFAVFF
jgi:hypothetical protein